MGRIKVFVANGSLGDIWCKLLSNKRTIIAKVNVGVEAATMAGLNAGRRVNYDWKTSAKFGYTKLGSGKALQFSQIADGGGVNLSIVSNGGPIWYSYILRKDENVIVDLELNIKLARKSNPVAALIKGQNKWIDKDGIDHNKALKALNLQNEYGEIGDDDYYEVDDEGKDDEGEDDDVDEGEDDLNDEDDINEEDNDHEEDNDNDEKYDEKEVNDDDEECDTPKKHDDKNDGGEKEDHKEDEDNCEKESDDGDAYTVNMTDARRENFI